MRLMSLAVLTAAAVAVLGASADAATKRRSTAVARAIRPGRAR